MGYFVKGYFVISDSFCRCYYVLESPVLYSPPIQIVIDVLKGGDGKIIISLCIGTYQLKLENKNFLKLFQINVFLAQNINYFNKGQPKLVSFVPGALALAAGGLTIKEGLS